MDEMEASLSRKKLEFAKAVGTAFSFLIHDYNMRSVTSEPTLVRYESDEVFVKIYHELISSELGVEIGLMRSGSKGQQPSYGLEEVLETVLGKGHNLTTFYQSSNVDGVKLCVDVLAEIVKHHYVSVLRGNKDIFESIELTLNERSEEFMRARMLSTVREKALRAWQDKDYKKFVELYKAVESGLTESETKKLAYARKHTGNDCL